MAYVILVNMVLRGELTAAQFLLYFSAVTGFAAWVTGILDQCSTLYRQSLDLSKVRGFLDWPEPFRMEDGEPLEAQVARAFRGWAGLAAAAAGLVSAVMTGCIYLFVCLKAWAGAFAIGSVTQYVGGVTGAFTGISKVLETLALMRANSTYLETLYAYLDTPNQMYQGSLTTEKRNDRKYEIEFRDASFRYPGSEDYALRHMSIKFRIGERLESFPKGLDTYLYKNLDENGVSVSGGEAQKIAIARALYRDAPLIVLDEPTAALDPVAEAEIYSRFNEIVEDRTAIYISHRLSSCRFCDEILVFDQGQTVQQGSHEQLVADENSLYYALWNAQAQYYTE